MRSIPYLAAAAIAGLALAAAAEARAEEARAEEARAEESRSLWSRLFGGEEEIPPIVDVTDTETHVAYDVALWGAPSEVVEETAVAALRLYKMRSEGAASLPLLGRRAEADADLLKRILRSEGWLQPEVDVSVTGPEAAPAADAAGDGEPARERAAGRAKATLTIRPGPRFTLAAHGFVSLDPDAGRDVTTLDAAAFGSPVGGPAVAADIVRAEAAALASLRRAGFPYAALKGRKTVGRLEAETIRVDTRLEPGPRTRFGAVSFEGLESVDPAYLETYRPWEPDALFDESKLTLFQRLLNETNLFAAVSVAAPKEPPAPGPDGDVVAPVVVRVEEGDKRTIGGGLRFSTDRGLAARANFEHRNLLNRNETFRSEAKADAEELELGLGLRLPQFMRPGQDLTGAFVINKTESDRFDATSVEGTLGLRREVSPRLVWSLGAQAKATDLVDEDFDGSVFLAGLPARLRYDASDDRLDPKEGFRIDLEGKPVVGVLGEERTEFLRLDARASGYLPLDAEKRWVLAGRTRVASILSEELRLVPASERLYSGGGASVRGYAEDYIGFFDDDGPEGGRGAFEIGVELRGPVYGDFGFVLFVEGGAISRSPAPNFSANFQSAAGFGLRYASPVGPIRVDVAAPIEARERDDPFQIYFSIGQAF